MVRMQVMHKVLKHLLVWCGCGICMGWFLVLWVPNNLETLIFLFPHDIWLQNERELKRERRKQSNRESARRSRLRKQVWLTPSDYHLTEEVLVFGELLSCLSPCWWCVCLSFLIFLLQLFLCTGWGWGTSGQSSSTKCWEYDSQIWDK